MEQALLGLFSIPFFAYSLVVAISILMIRSVTETFLKKLKSILPEKIEEVLIDFWNEWILRGLPIFIGGILAYFVSQYPFPDPFSNSVSGKVFFGIIAGLFSSKVYCFTKFYARKYIPENIKQKFNKLPIEPTETTDAEPDNNQV